MGRQPLPQLSDRLSYRRRMPDLIIRNGRIADGTGAPTFVGDIAVTDGVITEVGHVEGNATPLSWLRAHIQ